MGYKDPAKNLEYQKAWQRANRGRLRERAALLRLSAIAKLGGHCSNCGCDDLEAIEFNHINGGGGAESRRGNGRVTMMYGIVAGRRTDIELTCRPCNALHYLINLKGLENRWKITYTPKGL